VRRIAQYKKDAGLCGHVCGKRYLWRRAQQQPRSPTGLLCCMGAAGVIERSTIDPGTEAAYRALAHPG